MQTMKAGEESSRRMDGAQEKGKLGIENPENTEEGSRTANVQLNEIHGVGKESSRRREIGSPTKVVKG